MTMIKQTRVFLAGITFSQLFHYRDRTTNDQYVTCTIILTMLLWQMGSIFFSFIFCFSKSHWHGNIGLVNSTAGALYKLIVVISSQLCKKFVIKCRLAALLRLSTLSYQKFNLSSHLCKLCMWTRVPTVCMHNYLLWTKLSSLILNDVLKRKERMSATIFTLRIQSHLILTITRSPNQ